MRHRVESASDIGPAIDLSSGRTVLVGLLGKGIQLSRTPAMHEREGDAQGMRYLYRLIDLDKLGLDSSALPQLLDALFTRYREAHIEAPSKDARGRMRSMLCTLSCLQKIVCIAHSENVN